MEVKNLILYQVATNRNYKVGDKLIFGESLNGQGNRVLNTKFYENDTPIAQLGFEYAESKKIFKNSNIVIKLSKNLAESDFVIRELAMEKVRLELAPNEPSRFKCMFLTANKDEVKKGIKIFYKKGFGEFFQAVAVKCNGKIFAAKDCVGRWGKSYKEYIQQAQKYWTQKVENINDAREILFEGEAEIVEILDELRISRQN